MHSPYYTFAKVRWHPHSSSVQFNFYSRILRNSHEQKVQVSSLPYVKYQFES